MSESEVLKRVMNFVKTHTGVVQSPDSVKFVQREDGSCHWVITYLPDVFFSQMTEQGSTIDGPYVLHVDDITGVVKVLG